MPLATEPLAERQARYDRIHAARDAGRTFLQIGEDEAIPPQLAHRIYHGKRPERQFGGRPRKAPPGDG